MTKIEKIKEIIQDYQESMREYFSEYQKKEKAAREKYSKEFFHKEFTLKTWAEMRAKTSMQSDMAVNDINRIFREINDEFNSWLTNPLEPGVAQVLNLINSFGLKLNLSELKALEQSVHGSYFGLKVFAGLAVKNGFNVEIPDAGKYLESLKAAKSNAGVAIKAFAGDGSEGFPGKDLLDEWVYEGISQGNYQLYHMNFASNFLKNNELDRLAKLWSESGALLHYQLSEEEAKNIQDKIDKLYNRLGDFDKKEADNLIKEIPDIVSRIDSLPNVDKNADDLRNYYLLNSQNKKDDSGTSEPESYLKASSSLELAKQYAASRAPVNEDILKHY